MSLRDPFCTPTRMRETTPIIRPTGSSSPRPPRADKGRFFGPVRPRGTDRNMLNRRRQEPSPASQYRLPTPAIAGLTNRRKCFPGTFEPWLRRSDPANARYITC